MRCLRPLTCILSASSSRRPLFGRYWSAHGRPSDTPSRPATTRSNPAARRRTAARDHAVSAGRRDARSLEMQEDPPAPGGEDADGRTAVSTRDCACRDLGVLGARNKSEDRRDQPTAHRINSEAEYRHTQISRDGLFFRRCAAAHRPCRRVRRDIARATVVGRASDVPVTAQDWQFARDRREIAQGRTRGLNSGPFACSRRVKIAGRDGGSPHALFSLRIDRPATVAPNVGLSAPSESDGDREPQRC